MYGAAGESTQRLLDWMRETSGDEGDPYTVYYPTSKNPADVLAYEEGEMD
jgi:hypothetical protein